jgi:Ricin-type beta-trefoil lectin domain/Right handed beta helix region
MKAGRASRSHPRAASAPGPDLDRLAMNYATTEGEFMMLAVPGSSKLLTPTHAVLLAALVALLASGCGGNEVVDKQQATETADVREEAAAGGSQTASSSAARIQGVASKLCLGVEGGSATARTPVQILDCADSASQNWEATAAGELRTFGGTRCLDVRGASVAPRAVVQSYPCNGGPNQRWTMKPDGTIVATQSGLCLTVMSAGRGAGTGIDTWPCEGASHQQWNQQSQQPVKEYACNSIPDEISGNVRFAAGCKVSKALIIQKSMTRLDCNGAQFDASPSSGLLIETLLTETQGIHDVIVENCHFSNARRNGILITGHLRFVEEHARFATDAARYAAAPNRILIRNTKVTNANWSEIYVDAYSQNVTLDAVTVEDETGAGVYLEYASRKNVIKNSLFIGKTDPTDFAKIRIGLAPAAIHVDGSASNLIANNTFRRYGGGVKLYKNCGEHGLNGGENSVPRLQGANNNVIRDNVFEDLTFGVGVAARQEQNSPDCGDDFYSVTYPSLGNIRTNPERFSKDPNTGNITTKGSRPLLYVDQAKSNAIRSNTFRNVDLGITVQDDGTEVSGNIFEGSAETLISVGTYFRAALLNRPVTGTRVENNVSRTSPRNGSELIKLRNATESSIIRGNTHNGSVLNPGCVDRLPANSCD